MSFVPAIITTYFGCRFITSCLNLTSISDVVCPLIPLQAKLLPVKNSESALSQLSVMESPIKTATGAFDISELALAYLPNLAQSWSCAPAMPIVMAAKAASSIILFIFSRLFKACKAF